MAPVTIIAEIGNTHEGSVGLAKRFILACAECGVDAVKFQTHIFDAESLINAPNPSYFKDESRKEYFERTSFSQKQWKTLKIFAEEDCHIEFISSPFSIEAVNLLDEIGVNTIKIPSGEISNTPLIERCARSGKNILLSSGMSNWEELDRSIAILKNGNIQKLTIMQCTSRYPCPPEDAGLNVISQLKTRYNLPVGFSDHTVGCAIPVASVVLGACVVEKHFTLSKKMYGSDAMNATEPDEFKYLVKSIRDVEKALASNIDKDVFVNQLNDMKKIFEKSIVASKNLVSGSILKNDDLAFKKPGDGIPAFRYAELLGKKLNKNMEKDHKLAWEDIN